MQTFFNRPIYDQLALTAHLLSATSIFLFGLSTLFKVLYETGEPPLHQPSPTPPFQGVRTDRPTSRNYFDL